MNRTGKQMRGNINLNLTERNLLNSSGGSESLPRERLHQVTKFPHDAPSNR